MQSTTTAADSRRELLIHCEVQNAANERSQRFIAQREFALWHFLVESKHGLHVRVLHPCIWLPASADQQHANLFSHSAFRQPVTKFTFEYFDHASGVTHTQTRYVAQSEVDKLEKIYQQHQLCDGPGMLLIKTTGAAISTTPAQTWSKAPQAATYYAA